MQNLKESPASLDAAIKLAVGQVPGKCVVAKSTLFANCYLHPHNCSFLLLHDCSLMHHIPQDYLKLWSFVVATGKTIGISDQIGKARFVFVGRKESGKGIALIWLYFWQLLFE